MNKYTEKRENWKIDERDLCPTCKREIGEDCLCDEINEDLEEIF